MQSLFNSEFCANNRRRLRELYAGDAPIVITANGLLQRGGDSAYSFAQDANFWYLTGLDEPDIVLVIGQTEEYLIVPVRSAIRQAFDGTIDAGHLQERSGIQDIYDDKEGWEKLGGALKNYKKIAALKVPHDYVEHYGFYTNPARAALLRKLISYNSQLEIEEINPVLAGMRVIKQPVELAAIQKAIDITISTIKEVTMPDRLAQYSFEYEIEAELARGFRMRGASGHAFDPIVAGGERACTLHNVANNFKLADDELVIIDVGAEFEHYAADITRTVSLSGSPSDRQQEVYKAVLDVQDYAKSLLKPGVLVKEYEQQVEKYMGSKLTELGLIKAYTREAVREFYPHGTSHFLGLNVHDVGAYNEPLQPGAVLTIEPGIYIRAEGVGVRIEDDVLITDDGIKVLTDQLPRQLA